MTKNKDIDNDKSAESNNQHESNSKLDSEPYETNSLCESKESSKLDDSDRSDRSNRSKRKKAKRKGIFYISTISAKKGN